MARPKGSKNKPKILSPAKQGSIPAKVAREAVRKVMDYKSEEQVIIKTTEDVHIEAKEIIERIINPKKIVQGWVNIYRTVGESAINYYTGSDIHYTKEAAKIIASKNIIGQVYINLEY